MEIFASLEIEGRGKESLGYIRGRSKASDAVYAIDVHATPDLDATSSCDGPEGALAMIQFLGIKSRQYGTQRGLF